MKTLNVFCYESMDTGLAAHLKVNEFIDKCQKRVTSSPRTCSMHIVYFPQQPSLNAGDWGISLPVVSMATDADEVEGAIGLGTSAIEGEVTWPYPV